MVMSSPAAAQAGTMVQVHTLSDCLANVQPSAGGAAT